MAITSEFMEAVNNGNRTRVRIMLKDIILSQSAGENAPNA